MGEILKLQSITKSFDGIKALQDISFSLNNTEILGLIGPNGSGKTTLFNIISGFIKPNSGKVFYNGKDITYLAPHVRAESGFGRLFQDIRVFNKLSVIENMLLAQTCKSDEMVLSAFLRNTKLNKYLENARHWLDFVGLEVKENSLAESLSYGQEKLLAIAMLLAKNAGLLLLDEPFAGLDLRMKEKISGLIKRVRDLGKTIIMIEHTLDFVFDISDRVVLLNSGLVAYEGNPDGIKSESAILKKVYLNSYAER